MAEQVVNLSTDERGVARVRMNRPERHNAFDDIIIAQLHEALDAAAADSSRRVLVLEAAGKSFSAGADLGWMRRMAEQDYRENLEDARRLASMLERLDTLPLPTIARVNGAAFGGAVGLAACCDLAVATEEARFCLSEAKLGLVPATVGPYVVRAVGPRAARRYFLTAEVMSAGDAERLNLVSCVTPAEDLDTAVEELVQRLLENGPAALAAAKRLVRDCADKPIDKELMEATSALIADIRGSGEGQEGVQAFLDKRRPSWRSV